MRILGPVSEASGRGFCKPVLGGESWYLTAPAQELHFERVSEVKRLEGRATARPVYQPM